MSVDIINKLLSTYSGRDKFLRTLSYTSLYISGSIKNEELGKRFKTLSSKISGTRATLRLFDDLPMLQHTLSYGFGKQEPDLILRVLNVVTNFIDQIFYPIEHVEWAASNNIISIKNVDSWSLANSICWCLSLYLTLLSCIRKSSLLAKERLTCLDDKEKQAKLRAEQHATFLLAVQSMLDLGHAIHWLPEGFLWGGKMQAWQRGLLGSLSSVISMYRAVKSVTSK